ncbi:MAG: hypothetical protein ACOC2N_04855, partial [Spirochaetota bacterium]
RFLYTPEHVAATITITALDDLVAEGTLTLESVGDSVRIGDKVVAVNRDEEPQATESRDLFPVLYDRVRRLR